MPSWTPDEFREYQRRQNRAADKSPGAEPERSVLDESLAEASRKTPDATRVRVSIESRRGILLDKDNLYGGAKFFVDSLRYCGAIRDDDPEAIDLEITQVKESKYPCTIITLEYFDLAARPSTKT